MVIESAANPTVKLLRSLETTKAVKANGLFVVEGVRAVEDALTSGRLPAIVLLSSELLGRTPRGRKLESSVVSLSRANPHTTVSEATPRALEGASGTQHPQGIIAAFPVIEWPMPPVPPEQGNLFLGLVCDNIRDPGNLGTLLRAAEAAGVHGVWLSPECAFAYSPKVVRAAMGAHFRLPIYPEAGWDQIQEDLRRLGIPMGRLFATEAQTELTYDSVNWREPSALIVSNEAHGLSEAARSLVGGLGGATVSIPMVGATESLNAAVAGAIILFEAARQRRTQTGRSA